MQRREFIAAAVGMAAAVASASQAFAQDYPDVGAIKKDTSMAACANAAYQLVAACAALSTLAAVNSEHTGHLAKTVEMICNDCKKECDKFPKITECKDCGEACKACADECQKIAT